jgi:RimJ/RimL family protein N-acetyltransferase
MSSPPDRPPPPGLVFRNWRSRDVEALCRHANNRNIWLNLLDRFPHPYTKRDAERWVDLNNATLSPPVNFAIELDGQAIGGVGMDRKQDVHQGTAEIGYWVAEPFWGRGIGTAAARFIADYAFRAYPLVRLEARVFEWNAASARVLERAQFTLEARLRQAVTKDGRVGDALLYARCRGDVPPVSPD